MTESQYIKYLYQLAESCPTELFQRRALNEFQKLIQFDTAGWCEVAFLEESVSILRAHFINLPPEYIGEYNEIEDLCPIGNDLNKGASRSYIANLCEDHPNMDSKFRALIDKYGIHRFLHTSIAHGSGLFLYIIAITRENHKQPFSQQDRILKERLTPHFVESFRICRRFDIQRKLIKRWELNRGLASCNEEGILFDADDYFVDLLKTDWPSWQEARLPAPLLEGLIENNIFKTRKNFYRFTLLDDLYLVSGTQLNSLEHLSNREFQIAHIFANGSTSKEIANTLSISPITVKNHLAHIYSKLNVNSKETLKKLFIA